MLRTLRTLQPHHGAPTLLRNTVPAAGWGNKWGKTVLHRGLFNPLQTTRTVTPHKCYKLSYLARTGLGMGFILIARRWAGDLDAAAFAPLTLSRQGVAGYARHTPHSTRVRSVRTRACGSRAHAASNPDSPSFASFFLAAPLQPPYFEAFVLEGCSP